MISGPRTSTQMDSSKKENLDSLLDLLTGGKECFLNSKKHSEKSLSKKELSGALKGYIDTISETEFPFSDESGIWKQEGSDFEIISGGETPPHSPLVEETELSDNEELDIAEIKSLLKMVKQFK
ncbi:MAG: hypothetical protein QKC75_gp3 [Anelloviridae sp.]|uniref:Uncharacterized protein n=1 Tax=Anelloviridae sp. TaxID=2055263 RepID=A0A3G2YSU5_9VIRU|nr:MAG: hypothetical protein QKC75_gp3 [Anelloviridae sp.]AYP28723.1 MAG: hypothetical protein [Anelloviridae sp.]